MSAVSTTRSPATEPAGTAEQARYSIVVVGQAGLADHVAAWDDLANHAVEPNAFYEPWALLPALACFAQGAPLEFVLIYLPPNAQRRQPQLCGFFPLARKRLCPGLSVVELWKHLYCFLCTPLLRAGHAVEVLECFLDWLGRSSRGAALWRLELVSADGPFGHALTEVCHRRQRPRFVLESYCRALIEPHNGPKAEEYICTALTRKRVNDFRRQERHLQKQGQLERRVLSPEDNVSAWANMFLQLEACGWKGREGTAMACKPADADFFRQMVQGAASRGRLLMLGLFLDGRPVALKCNFLSGSETERGSFAFKIAFDETYSACSPGVLLELANIEQLHQERSIRWMDSCAVPEHFMINRLWTERRLIQTEIVATGRAPGDLLVSLMPIGRWFKRLWLPRRGSRKEGDKVPV